MAKVNVNSLADLNNSSTVISNINTNFTNVQTAINNTLSLDGTSPNQMNSLLDMNSNRIINLPTPTSLTEPARLQELNAQITSVTQTLPSVFSVQLIKTATYIVVNGDNLSSILLGGNAFYPLVLNAPSGYSATFAIRVVNTDSTRGKLISPSGITSFILWPNQSVTIWNLYNVCQIDPVGQRWFCRTVPTFYVNVLGSDTNNDGLASGSSNAFATIQHAVDVVSSVVDLGGVPITWVTDNSRGVRPSIIIQLDPATVGAPYHLTQPLYVDGLSMTAPITLQGISSSPAIF